MPFHSIKFISVPETTQRSKQTKTHQTLVKGMWMILGPSFPGHNAQDSADKNEAAIKGNHAEGKGNL